MKLLFNLFSNKERKCSLEDIKHNLKRLSNKKKESKDRIWKERSIEEKINGDVNLFLINIQNFLNEYQKTRLCKEFGYYLYIKNINYVDLTVTLLFKHRNDEMKHDFYMYDFDRLIRGCDMTIGYNLEPIFYLQKKLLEKINK